MKKVRDKELYDQYLFDYPFCMVCRGKNGRHLSRHHIIGGAGRSDERCNLLVVCVECCHPLLEGARVIRNGERIEPITLGQSLSIKLAVTPDEWDAERLRELRGAALPDMEPIPDWVEAKPISPFMKVER